MSRRTAISVFLALAALAPTLAARADDDDAGAGRTIVVNQGTVIQNAIVVDTRDGSLRRKMSIVLDAGKIQKISPSRLVRVGGSAQAIDASGKYVVPGFNDMHTHSMQSVDATPPWWPLLIANGITGVREMSGSAAMIQRAQQLNADSAAGNVDAPEILTIPGDLFVGQIPTAAGAAQFVDQELALGAGFIKTVAGTAPATLALLAEAKKQGSYVAGHLSLPVSAADSVNAGWRAIEHLGAGFTIALDCSDQGKLVRAASLAGGGAQGPFPPGTYVISPITYRTADAPYYQQLFDSYDAAKCGTLADLFAKAGTWHTPTLIRLHKMFQANAPMYVNDPHLVYMDPTRRALWNLLSQQFSVAASPAAQATFAQAHSVFVKLTGVLHQHKVVNMMAGSDLGGIWVIPGFSLHEEFRELASAGLSPLEILQATTINAARFLNREATMGTVEEGRNANLVVLDRNPLEKVEHLDGVAGVFLRGKYFARKDLEALLDSVAIANGNQPLNDFSTVHDPTHRD